MINQFEGLLARLGFRRGGGRHFFALDNNLHTALVKLADQEKRPAEEVQAGPAGDGFGATADARGIVETMAVALAARAGCPGAGLPGVHQPIDRGPSSG